MASKVETIPITNFSGRLTRINNGDLNSGYAKFEKSFGYDPFTKPMQLTWLEQPSSIVSGGNPSDTLLVGKTRLESGTQIVYAVGSAGKIYRIQPTAITNANLDSVLGIGSVAANSPTFNFGASMEFFGTPERLYVGSDGQINSFPMSSVVTGAFAGDALLGSGANYASNTYRPLKPFMGKLAFGNGPTIGVISGTNTITSSIIGIAVGTSGSAKNIYSELNPPFPPETLVQDIDVTPDYNYLLVTASDVTPENIMTVTNDRQVAVASNGNLFQWNGSDAATTAGVSIPSQALTSLQTYLQKNIMFGNDAFGLAMGDGTDKILSLPNNRAPLPNATGVNGNFVFWINTEVDSANNAVYGSMYYFGALDHETPAGLYRVLRFSTSLANGYVYQTPFNLLVSNRYRSINNAINALAAFGWAKHYFSAVEISPSTTSNKLYRFLITPTGSGTPQLGVYETQTQLFSKRVSLSQLRVYCEPTVAGNGLQIDIIGTDGNIVTNGTFTYTFAAGDDTTKLLGAMERINFNPGTKTLYGFGIRVTNTGTTNMVVNKIEVDVSEEGK